MSKKIILLLIFSLSFCAFAQGQKGKKPRRTSTSKTTSKTEPVKTAAPTAPVIGSTVNIKTVGGDRISGELLDLTAFSVRLRSNNLESVIPFESISTISFGGAKAADSISVQAVSEYFSRDLVASLNAFQTMANETKTGSSYTDFDRQLIQLRRVADKFVQKYSATENPTESRIVALLSGAIIDYNSARTVWTLKIGSDGTLSDSEPIVADMLALYADLRATTVVGNRYNADKLVGGLWKKASEKIERIRGLINLK